jgi:hypothetical protein
MGTTRVSRSRGTRIYPASYRPKMGFNSVLLESWRAHAHLGQVVHHLPVLGRQVREPVKHEVGHALRDTRLLVRRLSQWSVNLKIQGKIFSCLSLSLSFKTASAEDSQHSSRPYPGSKPPKLCVTFSEQLYEGYYQSATILSPLNTGKFMRLQHSNVLYVLYTSSSLSLANATETCKQTL